MPVGSASKPEPGIHITYLCPNVFERASLVPLECVLSSADVSGISLVMGTMVSASTDFLLGGFEAAFSAGLDANGLNADEATTFSTGLTPGAFGAAFLAGAATSAPWATRAAFPAGVGLPGPHADVIIPSSANSAPIASGGALSAGTAASMCLSSS